MTLSAAARGEVGLESQT